MQTEVKKGFISEQEIVKFLNVRKLGPFGNIIAKSLMKVTRLDYLNRAYQQRAHLPAKEFIDSMFNYLGVRYDIYEKDIKRLPKSGAFITVSNHPLGGIDGMILIRTLLEQRSDFKVIANFLLERVEPLKPYILSVNPFEDRKDVRSSMQGLKSTLAHLRDGHPIGVFPAGEVSTKRRNGAIEDRDWLAGSIKLIQKAQVPVVPIYFHAYNSRGFYKMSNVSGTLRTALLPREMTTQFRRAITVRIGNPIFAKSYEGMSATELSEYLREKTYFLKNSICTKSQVVSNIQPLESTPIKPENLMKIKEELEHCRANDLVLFKYKHFEIFKAKRDIIPNVVNEIGRQREITFRAVGEGTNQELDLDKYDDYYDHLFIYDNENDGIVGAYRCGYGREIYQKYGISGFYLSELFDFDEAMHPFLESSLELGRAFIAKQYQRLPASLFLLWKGIIAMALKSDIKNIIGGVSISNSYTDLSKAIIIDFIKSYHYDQELAQHVKAKNPFRVDLTIEQRKFIRKDVKDSMQRLDKLIDEIEVQAGMNMPVLLKKYLKQNAKLFAFNIDPKFNNAIDGLMYVKVDELPEDTVRSSMSKFQDNISGG